MAEGTIKRLHEGKNFGFIKPDSGGEDVYFRLAWLKEATPQEGLRVQFEIERGDRGPRARNMRVLTSASATRTTSATVNDTAGYRFLNPYNFVRYIDQPRPQNHVLGDCPPPPHDRYVGLTGRITCKVEAVTPLFISDSHAVSEDAGHKTYRFFQVDGQPALPASSLRGMFRSVFEAVTNSCFVAFDGKRRLPYRDVNAARGMKPGMVKALASDDKPGLIALCKEAAIGAYEGSKKPIVLDSSWRTGDEGYAIIRRPKKGFPYVERLSRVEEKGAFKGQLKVAGKNIDTKLCERFFYAFEENCSSWARFSLERQQDYDVVLSAQFQEAGFSSTHQHPELTVGDLVYVELENDGETVKNIAITKVPRLRYRTAMGELLRYDHLQRCKKPDALCPACRVFGWVWGNPPEDADQVAYAGRVRFSHGMLTHSEGELPETTLAILSTPKPTTTAFYLLDQNGQMDPAVTYDTEGARLRGRKFYRHHGEAKPEEYQRDEKGDQNRTVKGALEPGATFTFTLDFENLAPLELGALLYALELDGMFHRLGYAKPLGFGSVKVTVKSMQTIDWRTRLRSVEPNAGWQPIDGAQYKQEFLETMQGLYGNGFAGVLADLQALLGTPPELSIHYPRPTKWFDPDHPQFEWFMGNKRRVEDSRKPRDKRKLPDPESLPLSTEEIEGAKSLPLMDEKGNPV